MSWGMILVAAGGWMLAAVLFVLVLMMPARARRDAQRSGLRLRSHVEPYLQRRASEVDLMPRPEPTNPSQEAEEIVDGICRLADRLTEHERNQVALGDTMNMAVSDTMPLKPGELLQGEKLEE